MLNYLRNQDDLMIVKDESVFIIKGNQNPHIKFTFIIKYSLLRTTSESLNKIRQRIRKLQL